MRSESLAPQLQLFHPPFRLADLSNQLAKDAGQLSSVQNASPELVVHVAICCHELDVARIFFVMTCALQFLQSLSIMCFSILDDILVHATAGQLYSNILRQNWN